MKKLHRISLLRRAILALGLCWPAILLAQDATELASVSRTYAITNVNIVQAPGRKIDMGTVVLKDGLILSVGKNIPIPVNAIIIKADSMYAYAGFVDGLSHVGVTKPKEEPQGQSQRPKDPGNPKPEEAGITPQNDVRGSLNPADKSVEDLRNVGFAVSHVVPYGGMMPGSGAIILLGGATADKMVLVNNSSFYSELTPAQRMYPGTVMGVMAKYRELYRQAVISHSYENTYSSNRSGIQRPTTDRVLEALYPVVDKRVPVLFKAEKVIDAQRVLTLQRDLGFTLWLAELKEGWDIVNKVKASNAKVFLSLDLPEEKKAEKKEEDKKGEGKKEEGKNEESKKGDNTSKKEEGTSTASTKAKTIADLEKETLEKRKADFIGKYVGQAATYQNAGVKFGFSTLNVKSNDIQNNLRRIIAAGLSEEATLASLTTSPAELLGLADRIGTIDNGKIANIVISDKPYFEEKSKVKYVFVDGNLYTLDVKEKKKGDPNAKVNLSGEWSTTSETPQGKNEGTVKFKQEGDDYSGTVSGSRMPQPVDLQEVTLDGNALTYNYTVNFGGQSRTVTVEATVEGDTFNGTVSIGQFGSFSISAKKNPN